MSKQLFKQTGPNSFQLISEGFFDRFKRRAPGTVADKPSAPTPPPVKNPEFADQEKRTNDINAAYDAFEGAVLKLKEECTAIIPSIVRGYKQGYFQLDKSLSSPENEDKIVRYLKYQNKYNSNRELVPVLPHYKPALELESKLNAVLPPTPTPTTPQTQGTIDNIVENCAREVMHAVKMWLHDRV